MDKPIIRKSNDLPGALCTKIGDGYFRYYFVGDDDILVHAPSLAKCIGHSNTSKMVTDAGAEVEKYNWKADQYNLGLHWSGAKSNGGKKPILLTEEGLYLVLQGSRKKEVQPIRRLMASLMVLRRKGKLATVEREESDFVEEQPAKPLLSPAEYQIEAIKAKTELGKLYLKASKLLPTDLLYAHRAATFVDFVAQEVQGTIANRADDVEDGREVLGRPFTAVGLAIELGVKVRRQDESSIGRLVAKACRADGYEPLSKVERPSFNGKHVVSVNQWPGEARESAEVALLDLLDE